MSRRTQTTIRTVILFVAIVNKILEVKGLSPLPLDDSFIEEVVSDLILVGSAVWAWWKNNSFTDAAIHADEVMDREKRGRRWKTK